MFDKKYIMGKNYLCPRKRLCLQTFTVGRERGSRGVTRIQCQDLALREMTRRRLCPDGPYLCARDKGRMERETNLWSCCRDFEADSPGVSAPVWCLLASRLGGREPGARWRPGRVRVCEASAAQGGVRPPCSLPRWSRLAGHCPTPVLGSVRADERQFGFS